MAIQNKLLQAAAGAGGAETDDNFNQTTLLLHGDGTNGAQNNTFLDSSSNAFTVTRNGNATQGSFSPYGDRWSNYFDGNRDYIVTPSDTDFAFGAGDFTIEHWINCGDQIDGFARSYAIGPTYDFDSVGSTIDDQDNAGKFTFYCRNLDVGRILISTSDITDNAWHHIAVTRQSGDFYLYVDGVLEDTNTSFDASVGIASQPLAIGGVVSEISGEDYVGYISDLRVVKGTAVYTSDFTPPTGPLTAITNTVLLTCQSNRFKDSSSNDFAITVNGDTKVTKFSPYAPTAAYDPAVDGGSGYFPDTDDNVKTASFSFGTSNFTLECWLYFGGNFSSRYDFLSMADDGTSGFATVIENGQVEFRYSGSNEIQTTATVAGNGWTHIAIVREGTGSNQTKIYLNGVQAASGTVSTNYASSGINISGDRRSDGGAGLVDSYLSDVRIVKGTAVYTSAFTPPTAPLTDITNTEILCQFTNAGIFDSTGKNNLETVGNAQIDTAVKKFGTGSMEFDGTGDYLLIAAKTASLLLGTSPFTIEFWFNTTSSTLYAQFVGNEFSGANGFTILINNASSTSGDIAVYNSGLVNSATSVSYRDGNWHHLAFVRDSSGSRLYLNGSQQGATNSAQSSASYDPSTFRWAIGANLEFGGRDYNGYIDDLRITKGVARYTAAFTPPSKAFPDQ